MASEDLVTTGELADLRRESLRTVLFCLVAALYLWYVILFQPINRTWPTAWGPTMLAAGLAVAFAVRGRHPSVAAAAAILGVAAANLCNLWLAEAKNSFYMLVVVVSLTGLFFGIKTVVWVTLLCNSLVIVIGFFRWACSPFSADLLSPVLVISAVGILSSLVVRNLYLTLHWALDRTMAAQRNEEEARDRRGQLARTVKALDEAYQRLEYLSYDLARAREAAEETRLLKQQFVTHVSHELRTPLNVVVALSEIMYLSPEQYGVGPLPPECRGDVREIYRSSKHLLRVIDDVLDMSQIEAGRMRIELEPVELCDVVSEALDMIRPLVREKEIELRTELPANLPPVLIDRDRVQQVLLNLLNNARRFTQRGSITVQAAVEAEQVRVTVADTGIGIPPGEHENMFKEFHQLESSIAQRQNGSGLGLAISKRFVEMQGGRIWVESEGVRGEGSRFHFTLPLVGIEPVKTSPVRRTRMTLRPPTGRGRTLLLLERDAAIVQMLEQGLEEYQIAPVDDVSEVPRLVDELHARAVVLNLAQRRQAWRQMRELRQTLGDSAPPVVLCPLVGEHQLGQSLGVMDYLIKPVTRQALTTLLDRFAESVRRVLVVDDDLQMVRLLSRMLQTAERKYEVTRAYDGRECLRQMRHQRPDLVLLDLFMPEMDGYSVLARMREDAELHDVPVAVVTAQGHTPEEERRLGGKMLTVYAETGFTNEAALTYLRAILDAVAVPSPLLRRSGKTV